MIPIFISDNDHTLLSDHDFIFHSYNDTIVAIKDSSASPFSLAKRKCWHEKIRKVMQGSLTL